ncbi:tetratricopeptide repeat protein [Streptomyces sp. ITFR-21]|nr:tetratricopeptide repeat protein [Streptomyces sp. ITFR-21]WNI19795.1 tetratricopeptide repeat protein [Streptomyces sp. ITFR-21]
MITETHHHYPSATASGDARRVGPVPWPAPDSVRTARAERPPRILRDRHEVCAALLVGLNRGGGDVHVIHGMGGSGKTSVALWAFHEAVSHGMVGLWVTASDRMALRAAMLAVAADRGAEPWELTAAYNGQRAAADLVWHYLDRSPQPWLLVIDNADDPVLLDEGSWLRASPGGTVVVTTRRATAALWRGAVLHRLDVLPIEDAAQVLRDLAPDAGDLGHAEAVARRLGCLPLALNLAGTYLSRQLLESWTMSDYHERLQDDTTGLIDQGADAPTGDSRHLVSRTWQITLNALTAQGVPEATGLLRLLSCMSPDPLPLMVLTPGAVAATPLYTLDPPLRGNQVEAALRALLDHSLAVLQEQSNGPHNEAVRCVLVHGLILDSVHAGIPQEQRHVYRRAAVDLLAAALRTASGSIAGPTQLLRLISPHITALLHRADPATAERLVTLALSATRSIRDAGDYGAALAMATLAASTSVRYQGDGHPAALAAQHEQGDLLRRLGKLDQAEQLLRQVHGQRSHVLGPDHPDTLQTAAILSQPLYLLGRHDESLSWLHQAIEGQRRVLGDDHEETLRSRALILEFLVDAGHSEEFTREGPATVGACERHLGPDHPVTVIAYSNYAYGLLHTGSPEGAEAAARTALAARIRLHGPEHPLVYSATLVLSWALMLRGTHGEAVGMMREAVQGRERLLGHDHPLSVKARVLLAERLIAAGRNDEGRQLIHTDYAEAERIYGVEDPDLIRIRALEA